MDLLEKFKVLDDKKEKSHISLSEQLEDDEDDFGDISEEAELALQNKIKEVDEQKTEDKYREEIQEEPVKRGRGRPKGTTKSTENIQPKFMVNDNDFFRPVMDSLSRELINNLCKENYSLHGYDKKTMKIIFEYIKQKIGE